MMNSQGCFAMPNFYVDRLLPRLTPEEYTVLACAACHGHTTLLQAVKLTGLSMVVAHCTLISLLQFGAITRIWQNDIAQYWPQFDADRIDWPALDARRAARKDEEEL